MEFSKRPKDFNAGKVQQYEEVRKGMTRIYNTKHHILGQSH